MQSLFKEKEWAYLQKTKEEGELTEFVFESNLGRVRYQFFKRFAGKVNDIQYYDIASYRGAEGPYIERLNCESAGDLLTAFLKSFEDYCEKNKIIAEFAKLDPWDEYASVTRKILQANYYGNFYCNDLMGDFYATDYNRRAKRAIRKALAMGVTVNVDYTGETIQDFVRLYQNTEEKYHTGDYYNFSEEDIKQYFKMLEGRCFLINAVVDNEIITSVFVAYGRDVMHYLYLGNNPKFSIYQGNSLLTYETSMIGKKLGLKVFDMGGGKPGGNIEEFKRNFVSDRGVYKYYAVKKIWNEKIYNALLNRKKEVKNLKMFPLYRG